MFASAWRLSLAGLSLAASCMAGAHAAGTAASEFTDIEAQSRALARASASVVGVRAVAVEDARSAATLGRARQGSGVVIDRGDLVLTIGYLILEAESVLLLTDDEREVPARPVAYDVATGFGLVQPLVPLRLPPATLGTSSALEPGAALMIVSGGEDGAISAAQLLSRRSFAGYWEYHVDGALFTAPARADHSGAGLFNSRGELVGIGSLVLRDVPGAEVPARGANMFVPIDLLPPILPELRAQGSSRLSRRAWLGINCVEAEGSVRVVRVNSDSPAEVAGLEPGDRIVRIDGTEVRALDMLWKTLWAGGAPEREVTLDIVRGGQAQTLKLQSVDRMKTLRRAQGI
jgi:S1-C subfamily serine protease